MTERIYTYLVVQGRHGATRNELADALGMKIQTLCARLRELEGAPKRQGGPRHPVRIRKTVVERGGCSVYIALEGGMR